MKSPTPAALERRLTKALKAYMEADSREEQVPLWREYVALHGTRAPETVARMEKARGLR